MPGQDDDRLVHLSDARVEVWAQSLRGRVRGENQDAWVACVAEAARWGPDPGAGEPLPPGPGDGVAVVAVFDGLGGHPHGRAAARAAARALPAVTSGTAPADILRSLDDTVRATRGYTTAVIALAGVPRDGLTLLSVGDSAAYAADQDAPGGVRLVSRRDRAADGRVTDCLGTGRVQGDLRRFPAGTRLLLVTDGVDSYAAPERLAAVLAAPPEEVEQAVRALFAAVLDAGAPDNATVLLLDQKGT